MTIEDFLKKYPDQAIGIFRIERGPATDRKLVWGREANVSRIVIMALTSDLETWLEVNKVNIVLRLYNSGWSANFDKAYAVHGNQVARPMTGADNDLERQLKAVQAFLWSLRGCRIVFDMKEVEVPEFTGIEEALRNARTVR